MKKEGKAESVCVEAGEGVREGGRGKGGSVRMVKDLFTTQCHSVRVRFLFLKVRRALCLFKLTGLFLSFVAHCSPSLINSGFLRTVLVVYMALLPLTR